MYLRISNRFGQAPSLKPASAAPSFPALPRVLTYSTRDVIDPRISVPAQHSLVRLSKNPSTNAAAVGMLEEIKAGRLAGIYCVNWKKAAERALRLGKSWWTVISPGEDAILMVDPRNPTGGPPLIAFRRELSPRCGLLKGEKEFASSPSRIDAALLKTWASYKLWQNTQQPSAQLIPPWIQQCLSRVLRINLPLTGVLDVQTSNALRSFQQRKGLTPSGRVDSLTLRTLSFITGCATEDEVPEGPIAVWAENIDAPGKPCPNARLRENGSLSKRTYPDGTKAGQAGWDMGINFAHLGNLVTQLTITPAPVQPGQVFRLAICAHGAPGEFQIDGNHKPALTAERIRTIKPLRNLLKEIGSTLSVDAVVLLMGCSAGASAVGSDLLIELSKIWRNHRVVGFTKTMSFGWGRGRLSASCSEPGYRDTNEDNECVGTSEEREKCEIKRYGPVWNDLTKLPWGSEFSPHAKIAKNGKILKKGGEP